MTHIRAVVFYLIDCDVDDCTFRRPGVPEHLHLEYKAGASKFDPFGYHGVGLAETAMTVEFPDAFGKKYRGRPGQTAPAASVQGDGNGFG